MEISSVNTAKDVDTAIPSALLWVKDAPLFIDKANLEQFYDSVVRPPFKEDAAQTIKISKSLKDELKSKFGGKHTELALIYLLGRC